MWFLSWVPFAVTHGQNPLVSDYVDYPAGVNLMWNTALPLMGIILSPITRVFGPVLAYNVEETLGLALSAWCAYLAIHRYVGSPIAAAIGGLLYGFSPFMVAHSLGHPHVTVAFIPPLMLLALDEILIRQRRPALSMGLLLGLLAAVQLLLGEELLAIAALTGLLGLLLLIALNRNVVLAHARYAARAFAIAIGLCAGLTAFPLAVQFFGPQRVQGILQEQNLFVSDLLGFVVPTQLQALAPSWAVRTSQQFAGDLAEWTAYLGIPLILLLGYAVIRFWSDKVVRFAALLAALLALLSLGGTLHVGGRVTHIPVAIVAFAFPLFQRALPVRVMLYAFLAAWLALVRLPVLGNLLPGRLTIFVYLLAGILLARFVDSVLRSKSRSHRILGSLATVVALLPLVPRLPYPATAIPAPAFFATTARSQIPEGSVSLVAPYSRGNEGTAMLWQAMSGLRYRMPEGYVYRAGPSNDPPPSRTQSIMVATEQGKDLPPMTEPLLQEIWGELRQWKIRTIIVGPMAHQERMLAFFAALLDRAPNVSGGVYWWEHVDRATVLNDDPRLFRRPGLACSAAAGIEGTIHVCLNAVTG
jgi:hypothetical protein